MKIPFVDLTRQYALIRQEITEKISEIISKGDFILGEEVRLFEAEFAQYLGVKYAIGVASGTDALYLSLLACEIGSGDEVITAANTYIATAVAITQTGARVVLADIDKKNYNIDPTQIRLRLSKKTRAIIPVHLAGQSAPILKILEIARENSLWVIEDAAQAHGLQILPGKKAGTFGDLACFSFYPSKNLGAYGDGGMVVTNNPILAEKVYLLRNYGQKVKNQHLSFGINSRLDNLQAGILRIKLRYLDKWNQARRQNARLYQEYFQLPPVLSPEKLTLPNPENNLSDHIYHLYLILAQNRDKLAVYLREKGIATGCHYPLPIHLQESYKFLGYKEGDFPLAEKYAQQTLSLPMFPELTSEEIKRVVDTVKEFYQR